MTEFISKMEDDECDCWLQQAVIEAMFLWDFLGDCLYFQGLWPSRYNFSKFLPLRVFKWSGVQQQPIHNRATSKFESEISKITIQLLYKVSPNIAKRLLLHLGMRILSTTALTCITH
jgi:hypothetical protein